MISVTLDSKVCRRARLSRDTRFDGQFFTAVKTTGIFCRSVCPAQPPKEKNVLYYPSAAAAFNAGYRPCLRCRPEVAPRSAAWQGAEAIASRVLNHIQNGFLAEYSVLELAEAMGISERYVRDLCQRYCAASPIQIEQARRTLLAKQLLFDSNLSITDIAFASGYKSVRRFNEHWKSQYGKAPSAMRKKKNSGGDSDLVIHIPVSEYFDYGSTLQFLAGRAVHGVEYIDRKQYQRVIKSGQQYLAVSVEHEKNKKRLRVSCSKKGLTALPDVIAQIKRVFDVDAPVQQILQDLSSTRQFKSQLKEQKDIRLPGAFDPFEAVLRAIAGQQVTVKAARTLLNRLVERCGPKVKTANSNLSRAFPEPAMLIKANLDKLGLTTAKIDCIRTVAKLAVEEPEIFALHSDPQWRREKLLAIKGIGPWTVSYLEMRAFSMPDAMPAGDLGVRMALEKKAVRPTEKQVLEMSKLWQPWRAYATLLLWQRLS